MVRRSNRRLMKASIESFGSRLSRLIESPEASNPPVFSTEALSNRSVSHNCNIVLSAKCCGQRTRRVCSFPVGTKVVVGRAADIGLKRRLPAWTYRSVLARSALQVHDRRVQPTGQSRAKVLAPVSRGILTARPAFGNPIW